MLSITRSNSLASDMSPPIDLSKEEGGRGLEQAVSSREYMVHACTVNAV